MKMPRAARVKSKTGIYHIVLRGSNRQTIFEDSEDASRFVYTLREYKEKSNYEIYAYCLMGNHVHIMIKENEEDLGIAMRRIGASYVYWYNKKYERCGHLFQDRYKSEVIEDESYLLQALRYIHQNPVKAGLVKDPRDYKWSSYFEYLNYDGFVDSDFILDVFSSDRKNAIKAFEEYHNYYSNSSFLEFEENKRITDEQGIEIIKKLCDVVHCFELQRFDSHMRNRYIKKLKEEGLSSRQISRLTGISRVIITNA